MKKCLFTVVFLSYFSSIYADSTPANPSALVENPWEKFSLSVGAFFSDTDSGVRIGSGLGVDVDVEDVLGLEGHTSVARAESFWRFTKNRKHRLDLSWFALRRSANRQVGQDFDIRDREGNTITIKAGSNVESHFNLDIIETAYSYSLLQDDRVDVAGVFGVYVMPIRFGVTSTGNTNTSGDLNFTAPLPVVGLRLDVALTPKWFLRSGSQIFAIDYQGFSGRLTQLRAAVEYLPIRHLGVGLGVDSMRFAMQATSNNYPNVDVRGNVDFQYTGVQLYGKYFF